MWIVGYATHAMVTRLTAELKGRGHHVDVIDPAMLGTELDDGVESAVGLPGGRPDLVVLAVSTDQISATLAVRTLMDDGIPVLNPPRAVLLAADKFATARVLAAAGLPVPRTVNVCTAQAVVHHGERLGWPVVLKSADGSEGTQVTMLRGEHDVVPALTEIRATLGLAADVRNSLVLQEVVEALVPGDRRIFVAGGQVMATMDRLPRPGEWRSNLSLLARPVAARATPAEERLARRAMSAVGLDFGTVDIMRTSRGPVVIELNAFGDVLDVAVVSGIDLVGSLADVVEQRAGLCPDEPVSPRELTDEEAARLRRFCWDRLDAKREQLGLADFRTWAFA
ncbi:hypothetical protein KIH74_13925 [Kineosporia sp. J2-2]|uniref:ATP-grasp domain-containing protein n=1 Tax=Kineosporia corallincola TaxID=2835133 RepID=A0ABS5TG11_9ACTN|nr:hypothetical protein [Kineosporia corallincola]MBT0770032.1 hypothetical protein [Kineosporia corallincola]